MLLVPPIRMSDLQDDLYDFFDKSTVVTKMETLNKGKFDTTQDEAIECDEINIMQTHNHKDKKCVKAAKEVILKTKSMTDLIGNEIFQYLSLDDFLISLVVHQMIVEKFNSTLSKIQNRSLLRRLKNCSFRDSVSADNSGIDTENNNYYDYTQREPQDKIKQHEQQIVQLDDISLKENDVNNKDRRITNSEENLLLNNIKNINHCHSKIQQFQHSQMYYTALENTYNDSDNTQVCTNFLYYLFLNNLKIRQ